MAHTFSEYLPHFAIAPRRAVDFGGRMQPLDAADAPPVDGPAEAEARGRREALAEATAEFEAIRARDQAAFAAELARKEREFAEATGDILAERLTAGLAVIGEAVSDHVASALSRFLDNAIRTRAVSELCETVAALLVSSGGARIRVSGPQALVNRVRERLSVHGGIVFVADASPDVTVAIDDTIIETQITAWEERLKAAVAGSEGR